MMATLSLLRMLRPLLLVRPGMRRSLVGLFCLLTSLPLPAQSVSTENKPPSELEKVLVDMMRRDHIDRTRSTYVSSSQWQAHCDAFHGTQDKTWCEEQRQKALNGEARLHAIM
jgi:hypothetical protein